jgi:hypothetical protein
VIRISKESYDAAMNYLADPRNRDYSPSVGVVAEHMEACTRRAKGLPCDHHFESHPKRTVRRCVFCHKDEQ